MTLQITGALPAQPNDAQAQALYALANIQTTVQAADARIQHATNETFRRMQDALHQSEANILTLSEHNAQLTLEIQLLRQQIREVTSNAELKKQSEEKINKAERERIQALLANIDTDLEGIIKCAIDTRSAHQASIPEYSDCCLTPRTRSEYIALSKREIEKAEKLLQRGKNIQSLITQINK